MGPTKWTFLPHTQQDFFLLSLTNSIITVSGKSEALFYQNLNCRFIYLWEGGISPTGQV